MSWFSKSATETLPAPAPPIDNVSNAQANLVKARMRLKQAESALKQFNRDNFVFVNGRRCLRVPTVNGMPDYSVQRHLESEATILRKTYATSLREFQGALENWSVAKLEAK
jgi:hypothetical protein